MNSNKPRITQEFGLRPNSNDELRKKIDMILDKLKKKNENELSDLEKEAKKLFEEVKQKI